MKPQPLPSKLLRYLISVLNREINLCGLDTEAGTKAQIAREMIRITLDAQRPRRKAVAGTVSTVSPPKQTA